MTNTYTYTARNADQPDLVVTFTLEDEHLRLSLPEVLEQVGQIAHADEKVAEAAQQLKVQVKPGALKVIQSFSGPVHLGDTAARLTGESLKVRLWQRVAGLRLAPLWLDLGQVDNPEAAEAFVAELARRKAAVSYPGRFFGPLDYWVGWTALLLFILVLLRWSRKRARMN